LSQLATESRAQTHRLQKRRAAPLRRSTCTQRAKRSNAAREVFLVVVYAPRSRYRRPRCRRRRRHRPVSASRPTPHLGTGRPPRSVSPPRGDQAGPDSPPAGRLLSPAHFFSVSHPHPLPLPLSHFLPLPSLTLSLLPISPTLTLPSLPLSLAGSRSPHLTTSSPLSSRAQPGGPEPAPALGKYLARWRPQPPPDPLFG
jgi:hypothetical protein